MKGHTQIIELRRKGYSPEFIRIDDWMHGGADDCQTVCLEKHDAPEQIDWRFTVGRMVMVAGDDADRVQRIYKSCSRHAKRVIATTFSVRQDVKDPWGGPVKEVSRIDDTEGVMTWLR